MNIINEFAIKKMSSVVIETHSPTTKHNSLVMDHISSLRLVGFKLDKPLISYLMSFDNEESLRQVMSFIERVAGELKGGNLKFKALRSSFIDDSFADVTDEDQFMQMIQYMFYSNDVGGYSQGVVDHTDIKSDDLTTIHGVYFDDILSKFNECLSSKESSSDEDKRLISELIENDTSFYNSAMKSNIVHKEMMSVVVSALFNASKVLDVDERKKEREAIIKQHIDNVTDVLRVATAMSNGDTSLAEHVEFIKFPRQYRKFLCDAIKHCVKKQPEFNFNEDLLRHVSKWKLLSKFIHVGDYGLHSVFTPLRENSVSIETFNSIVENESYYNKISMLKTRPTEFCRRLNDVLVKHPDNVDNTLKEFSMVGSKVSMNALLSAHFHFGNIDRNRFIMPKSGKVSFQKLPESKLDRVVALRAHTVIAGCINEHLSSKEPLSGEFYIDESLFKLKIPTALRNSSRGLLSVGRGSRLKFNDDKKVIRLFTHWIGEDLDLSFYLLDTNMKMVEQVAYYNRNFQNCVNHSGDFTYAPAPKGASEFVDIDIESVSKKARYGIMYVNVFSGPKFHDMDECVTGWLERDTIDSKVLVDPSKVKNLINLESNGRESIPLIIDFHNKDIIWCDLACDGVDGMLSLQTSLMDRTIELDDLIWYVLDNDRMSVGELLRLNVINRGGTITDVINENTTVWDYQTGFDVSWINSEML